MPQASTTHGVLAARGRCGRLVAWGNAALVGRVSPDTAADRVAEGDLPQRVCSGTVPGGPDTQTLTVALARWTGAGTHALRLLLPVPGDPVGLPGRGPFTTQALDLGAAVLLDTGPVVVGLLPHEHEGAACWVTYPVEGASPVGLPALAEADRALAEALREVTSMLTRLDVARWEPAVGPALDDWRAGRLDGGGLAPGYPDRAHAVLARARRLTALVELSAGSDGGAVTAGEMAARRAALAPLARAARRAEVAAHNAILEPAP